MHLSWYPREWRAGTDWHCCDQSSPKNFTELILGKRTLYPLGRTGCPQVLLGEAQALWGQQVLRNHKASSWLQGRSTVSLQAFRLFHSFLHRGPRREGQRVCGVGRYPQHATSARVGWGGRQGQKNVLYCTSFSLARAQRFCTAGHLQSARPCPHCMRRAFLV